MENNIIRSINLEKTVHTQEGELTILRGINLEVKCGETIAIIGPSGSGKSSLLGLLAAMDTPSRGDIMLDGISLASLDEEAKAKIRKDKLSFIFQSFLLVDTLNALENVMLPAELAGVKDAKSQALVLLTKVGLAHRINHLPKQLSGGEQQRVAIARAFICRPKVLFADEPTGNLDAQNGEKIADMLFAMNEHSDTTLVLVTHDEKLARRCQRQLLMQDGQLTEVTAIKETTAQVVLAEAL